MVWTPNYLVLIDILQLYSRRPYRKALVHTSLKPRYAICKCPVSVVMLGGCFSFSFRTLPPYLLTAYEWHIDISS
jgi:hypothetical protein